MQLEFFDVPSPCIGVCQVDDKGQCLGCFRTRDERVTWISLTSDHKQKVIKRCTQRKKRKEGKAKTKAVEDKVSGGLFQPSLLESPKKTALDKSEEIDFGDFEL